MYSSCLPYLFLSVRTFIEYIQPLLIGLGTEEHIVVALGVEIGHAIDFEDTIYREKGHEEPSVVLDGEAFQQIGPDDPVAEHEKFGQTFAHDREFAEEEIHGEIGQETVDEEDVLLALGNQPIVVAEDERARHETLQVADGDFEVHALVVALRIVLEHLPDFTVRPHDGGDYWRDGLDVQEQNKVAYYENAEVDPLVALPVEEEIEGNIHQRGDVHGERHETDGEIGPRTTILQILQRIGEEENGDGVAHKIGHETKTAHADEYHDGERNVVGASAQETEQEYAVDEAADEDEELIAVHNRFADQHKQRETRFEVPLVVCREDVETDIVERGIFKARIVERPVGADESTEAEEDEQDAEGENDNTFFGLIITD
jgi:hypothetical protein